MHIAYPGDGIPQFRQALEEGFFSKFVFVDSMKTSEMIVNVGAEFLNGAICAAPEAMETEASLRLRTAYVGRYSEAEVAVFIGNAYDAMFIMALAIEKAGSADRTAARCGRSREATACRSSRANGRRLRRRGRRLRGRGRQPGFRRLR